MIFPPPDPAVVRLLCPTLVGEEGHEASYTRLIVGALQAEGVEVFVHAPSSPNVGAETVAFEWSLARRNPQAGRLAARLAWERNRRAFRKAAGAAFARGGRARWFVHTAPIELAPEMAAAWRAAGQGTLAFMLRADDHAGPRARAQLARTLPRLRTAGVTVCTDSEDLAALYRDLDPGSAPVITAPPVALVSNKSDTSEPPVLAYLGSRRVQKGFNRLPAVLEAAARTGEPYRAVVQAYPHPDDDEGATAAAYEALRRAGALLLDAPLPDAAFAATLARADLVILPYDTATYRRGSSGVFAAAAAAGAAVLVPEGAWMAAEARRRGLTRVHVVDFSDPAGVEAALRAGLRRKAPPGPAERAYAAACDPRAVVRDLGLV